MGVEIERKFLVKSILDLRDCSWVHITQGYLSAGVRIRIVDNVGAFITIKGRKTGISCAEFEYPIPVKDAKAMLPLCKGDVIYKTRRKVKYKGKVWEVDEFLGSNLGLVMAEIELKYEDEIFEKPKWVGKEVSISNYQLSKKPYKAK